MEPYAILTDIFTDGVIEDIAEPDSVVPLTPDSSVPSVEENFFPTPSVLPEDSNTKTEISQDDPENINQAIGDSEIPDEVIDDTPNGQISSSEISGQVPPVVTDYTIDDVHFLLGQIYEKQTEQILLGKQQNTIFLVQLFVMCLICGFLLARIVWRKI